MPTRLEIAGATPPSINKMGSRGSWRVWNKHKKWWQEQIGLALMIEIKPKRDLETPVLVDAVLWFKVNRGRDEGNFRSLLEKATGDALVSGGWIPDDTPDYFQFRGVRFMKGNTATTLLLREGWDDPRSSVRWAGAPPAHPRRRYPRATNPQPKGG
jgi:hypothetical protein